MALSDNVCFVCSCTQAVDPDGSELDIYLQEDVAEDLFAEGETEGSDEELGVHAVSPTASHEGRAELDHLDSRDAFAVDMSEQEVEVEEDTGNVSEDRVVETSSDEEEEEEIAEPVQPRRRLRGKQPAPQYGPPPQPAADNPGPGPSGTAPSSSRPGIKRPAIWASGVAERRVSWIWRRGLPVLSQRAGQASPSSGTPRTSSLHFLQEGDNGGEPWQRQAWRLDDGPQEVSPRQQICL